MNRIYISTFVCLLLIAFSLNVYSQQYLPSFWQNQTPGVVDFLIPEGVISINVSMRGGSGGDANAGCYYEGGKGAVGSFILSVNYCSGLKPGGTLRFITGAKGTSATISPNVGSGGGGGGSAILYRANINAQWEILAVSGGGGGASFAWAEINGEKCYGSNGGNANQAIFNGHAGIGVDNIPGGQGGTNGSGGGSCQGFGGGGAFSDGYSSGNEVNCVGKKGYPDGGVKNGVCEGLIRYSGGFGFGSGGVGSYGGGGGGGYSGGGGGCLKGGGGGGGSFYSHWCLALARSVSAVPGDGLFLLICATGSYPSPISLATNTLPGLEIAGCNVNQSVDFGFSNSEKPSDLSSFNAAGGIINPGGCTVQNISYIDTLDPANPTTVVNRTWKLVDQGGNIVRAKQIITIKRPSLLSTISPPSQTTCINLTPGTITADAYSQFGITVKWYIGEDVIFSNANLIPNAVSLSYTPTTQSNSGTYYYFCRITDGCGTATNKISTVTYLPQAANWYKDADGDNYYDANATVVTCTSPGALYKRIGLLGVDCNDNDNTVYPGAPEICDGKDNNCNGTVDESCCPAGNILYVKQDATGANNGSSWANAYTSLQAALASTCAQVTQIWVAKGTYKPTATTDRTIAFVMRNNLAIYGGFNGTETQINTRRPIDNPTILSGDIGTVGNNSDNSYSVVRNYENGLNASAVLDGFFITGGNANLGGSFIYRSGGGIHNFFTSPSIRNCSFTGNNAITYGGGIFNQGSAPGYVNCIVAGNTASQGAGMFNDISAPTLINVTIAGNLAGSASNGALYNYGAVSPTLKNSIIWGNNSGLVNSAATPVIANSIVQTNTTYLPQDSVFILKPAPGFGNVGDLRLPPCSPAIDAGNFSFFPFTNFSIDYKDIQGNIRDFGGNIDMGAYERWYPTSITYVDSSATGNNDGTSWANAYTSLEKAIRDMNYCENKPFAVTIYIAKGTYPVNGQATTLLNRSNASLLGGFPTDGSERDPASNPVIIVAHLKAMKNITVDGLKIKKP